MSCDYYQLSHTGIQNLAPYIPGKSSEALARESGLTDIIKLASNENPLGCSPFVNEVLQHYPNHQIATYPISGHHPLCSKIADYVGVEAGMITLSNGSDMLFHLILTCFALHTGKHILVHDYSFIVYRIFSQVQGIPFVSAPLKENWVVDIDAIIAACTEKTAIIFIANPNNPTGYKIPQNEIERLLSHIPSSTLLVLDEAYYEFNTQTDGPTSVSLLSRYPNLIITRTFSKAYGLAGLRIGYAIASEDITNVFLRALPSFTVNQIALVAADAALEDQQFIQRTIDNNYLGLTQLKMALNELGIHYMPTAGNFITIDCQRDAMPIYEKLQQYGIIVRPLHPYGLNNYLRVSVGTPEQNSRFLKYFSLCKEELA